MPAKARKAFLIKSSFLVIIVWKKRIIFLNNGKPGHK
jgi:hypothetical protein